MLISLGTPPGQGSSIDAEACAIKSLYASGTLSMKVGGADGPSLVQPEWGAAGLPSQPYLVRHLL